MGKHLSNFKQMYWEEILEKFQNFYKSWINYEKKILEHLIMVKEI